MSMELVGEVNRTATVHEFEWKIQNFMSFFEKADNAYRSSDIYIAGDLWSLTIVSNALRKYDSHEYIDLLLYRKTCVTSIVLEVFFSFKSSDERENWNRCYAELINLYGVSLYAARSCLSKTECLQKKSKLLPSNILTVLCTVKYSKSEDSSLEMLSENFRRILLHGTESDTILKVEGREFKVHKAILIARSPVFALMFTHDLAEKNSNVVTIPDCTADAFEIFLHYLYCGRAKFLTSNVYNVYYASDKYQVDDLKNKCVAFMMNRISPKTFCDVFALSLLHGESKLQEQASTFFCLNKEQILKTEQWQNFVAENPISANELLMKSCLTA